MSLTPYGVALWFRMAVAANPEKYVFREESSVPIEALGLMLCAISAIVVVGFLRQSRLAWNAFPPLLIVHGALMTWTFVSEISQDSGLGFCHVLGPRLSEVAAQLAGTQLFLVSAVALMKPSMAIRRLRPVA